MKRMLQLVGVSALVAFTGCMGPYKVEKFEEIGPNETAFVIPLEGETKEGQAQLQSVEYLEKSKVVAKRISIPQREKTLGRGPGNFEWIPTVRVVKVDRTPVTREWTRQAGTGTSNLNQAIGVESLDSINFSVGVNITCSVEEDDTAKFLYFYAGKPLSEVVDSNVRGFLQTVLAREFGQYMLTDCPKKKTEVFAKAYEEARLLFETKGVTVNYLGSSEGLNYDDPKIQEAINRKFIAENDILVAKQEKLAQDERNLQVIEKARTEAESAKLIEQAREALTLKTQLEVQKIQAEAMRIAAEKWNGTMPSTILPQGTQMLFGLDAPRK